MKKHQTHGFTLLELSIVVVIIGLIVAGISAGQSLVKQASLRNIPTEINQYVLAINSFKLAYDAKPGDMSTASQYWTTTDGNGDRIIDWNSNTEDFFFWDHLQEAGFIEGQYDGSGTNVIIGVNAGVSNYSGSSCYSAFYDDVSNNGAPFDTNTFRFGLASNNQHCNDAVLTAAESKSIDEKFDDGEIDSGKMTAETGVNASGTCFTGTYPSADYNLSNAAVSCRVQYLIY